MLPYFGSWSTASPKPLGRQRAWTRSVALRFPEPTTSLPAAISAGLKDHGFSLLVKAVSPDRDC